MKTRKSSRILAAAALVILALAIVTAILGATGILPSYAFKAAFATLFLLPVFLYLMLMVAKVLRPKKSQLIDTVVLDLGNVIFDFPWKEHAKGLGLSEEVIGEIKEKLIKTSLWNELDLGRLTYDEAIAKLCSKIPEHEADVKRFLQSLPDCIKPYDYAETFISALKKCGCDVYYLSNWSKRSHEVLTADGTMDCLKLTDGGVFSFEVKEAKPEPAIYKILFDKYKLDPARCIFIDDREDNIKTARSLQMPAIQFNGLKDCLKKLRSVGIDAGRFM